METYIKEILSRRKPIVIQQKGLTPSAVLLLMVSKGAERRVLFTKRSQSVAHHKGEMSFPGGVQDSVDKSLLHTALREVQEEIGVVPSDITILGRLDDVCTTKTDFVITPYVGMIPYPYLFCINRDEIADLLTVSVKTLCRQYHPFRAEKRTDASGEVPPSFDHGGNIIWGATARVLCQFLELFCKKMM